MAVAPNAVDLPAPAVEAEAAVAALGAGPAYMRPTEGAASEQNKQDEPQHG